MPRRSPPRRTTRGRVNPGLRRVRRPHETARLRSRKTRDAERGETCRRRRNESQDPGPGSRSRSGHASVSSRPVHRRRTALHRSARRRGDSLDVGPSQVAPVARRGWVARGSWLRAEAAFSAASFLDRTQFGRGCALPAGSKVRHGSRPTPRWTATSRRTGADRPGDDRGAHGLLLRTHRLPGRTSAVRHRPRGPVRTGIGPRTLVFRTSEHRDAMMQ
jgi:hypothetical protein